MKKEVDPQRLVVSLLAREEVWRATALKRLAARLGPLDYLSAVMPFPGQAYYGREMDLPLTRRLAAFRRLVPLQGLETIKRICMSLESDLAHNGRRRVNLDPGLLGIGSLMLATTKHRDHRSPLGRDLYLDLTLWFHDGVYKPLAWTYQDYASPEMLGLLRRLRQRYLWQLRRQAGGV